MQEDERDFIGALWSETRTKERDASAVRALNWFYFFTGNVGGDDGGARGQTNFQKWLRLIFDSEFDFGERFAFDSDKGGDDGAFGDGGKEAAVEVDITGFDTAISISSPTP